MNAFSTPAWARTPAPPMPEPAKPFARYLTVGGATVDVTPKPEADEDAWQTKCIGCDEVQEHNRYYGADRNLRDAREWAQAHAEKCRAMPMEG
ncbi:hypothetical protein OG756_42170 (plasmid) [Streptomyces sp. NBC_01310]|uniref:hypothetical protein n=1 Tax=Streptomyces sp. NBC_01310 TaxID=2903820 RepID=UPI0035B62985|nr:hypothetical protein OG756_42170 [Streptomyces sp. NBC_01310]